MTLPNLLALNLQGGRVDDATSPQTKDIILTRVIVVVTETSTLTLTLTLIGRAMAREG